mmetsp:Transcript_6443/g.23932  ORF Transcript_6443/g.23932 Transcript_6443/m.23932 type:complete len:326 (-) Transcript_6443:339-1316(-)
MQAPSSPSWRRRPRHACQPACACADFATRRAPMPRGKTPLLLALVVAGAACCAPPRVQALDCAGALTYQVTFEGTWTQASHPQAWVPSAHWSAPVVAAHASGYVMWEAGGIATQGVKSVAETGSTLAIKNELGDAVAGGTVKEFDTGSNIFQGGVGSTTMEVTASCGFPLASAVSMIAPSPDWMAGVSGLDLCDHQTGRWKSAVQIDCPPVDAGTDSGTTLQAANQPTVPKEPISFLGLQFGEDPAPVAAMSFVAQLPDGCDVPASADVNSDGAQNVIDIVESVNAVVDGLGGASACTYDVNADGAVNISDVVLMVDAVLGCGAA